MYKYISQNLDVTGMEPMDIKFPLDVTGMEPMDIKFPMIKARISSDTIESRCWGTSFT